MLKKTKKDHYGRTIIEEEKTNKFGKVTKMEKKLVVGADGNLQLEEDIIDHNGKKL